MVFFALQNGSWNWVELTNILPYHVLYKITAMLPLGVTIEKITLVVPLHIRGILLLILLMMPYSPITGAIGALNGGRFGNGKALPAYARFLSWR